MSQRRAKHVHTNSHNIWSEQFGEQELFRYLHFRGTAGKAERKNFLEWVALKMDLEGRTDFGM